jgi:hypothetical protein
MAAELAAADVRGMAAELAAAALGTCAPSLDALDAAIEEHLSKIDELSAALDTVSLAVAM